MLPTTTPTPRVPRTYLVLRSVPAYGVTAGQRIVDEEFGIGRLLVGLEGGWLRLVRPCPPEPRRLYADRAPRRPRPTAPIVRGHLSLS